MHGRSHRKTVCLSNSEAGQRYTPRKKGWDIRDMRRSTVHQKLGRDTHPERKGRGVSWVRRSALWRCVNHTYRTILPGLCLRLASCLVSSFNLTGPWILLKRSAQFFSKMDPTAEANGCTYTLPISTPKKPSCTCVDREEFLDLRSGQLPVSWL